MINRVLLYNSGGGIGDAIQMLSLLNTLKNELKNTKFYYLSAHENHFNSTLKDLNCEIESLNLKIKYFGFRWWHALIVQKRFKMLNIESFDLILDLQSKIRNSLILKIIPHKYFISTCFNFKLSTPNLNIKKENKIDKTILKAVNTLLKKNYQFSEYNINKVHEKFSEASLHIIGKNENYFNNLKTEVINKNAKSSVNYYGHISLLDLPKHIAKAALVIVPSKGETFGFTIVEAMALEKVTIVSNIPVAKEIITHQEDGFIANTDKDFINHISEVFQNPEAFSQMENKAREKVIKNFSQELMVNNSFKYYEEILAEKK